MSATSVPITYHSIIDEIPLRVINTPASNRPQKNWWNKEPIISRHPTPYNVEINGKTINVTRQTRINNVVYDVANQRNGAFHKVFDLVGTNRILKALKREDISVKRNEKTLTQNDLNELALAQKYNLPFPVCYVRPDEYTLEAAEGGFFVMEKIPHKVEGAKTWLNKPPIEWTDREKNVLNLVNTILNLHYTEKKEIVSDLFPRNVMVRDDDTAVLVDLVNPHSDGYTGRKLDLRTAKKIYDWCENDSQVFDFVTRGLPIKIIEYSKKHIKEQVNKKPEIPMAASTSTIDPSLRDYLPNFAAPTPVSQEPETNSGLQFYKPVFPSPDSTKRQRKI